jgi:acyl carrier protein
MSQEITPRVIKVMATILHRDPASITPESTFEQLGLDSLDGIHVAFGLESEFDVDIPDEELPKLKSVGDIVKGIQELLARKGAA